MQSVNETGKVREPLPSVIVNGRLDFGVVRQRAMDNAVDIDVVKSRDGRKWVKDFPMFVRIPLGELPSVDWAKGGPDGTVEARFMMRYTNGKAEYVLETDDNGQPIGRLIHGAMEAIRPEIDSEGFVITGVSVSGEGEELSASGSP